MYKRQALGSDHGGYDLKQEVIGYLKEKGIAFKDFGCMGKESCDYPEYGRAAAEAVAGGEDVYKRQWRRWQTVL